MKRKPYLYYTKDRFMGTAEIKQELQKFINNGDETFIKMLYESAKQHLDRLREDKLMAEAEADIKAGRLHGMDEVQNLIEDWTKG